jgi:tol-pal system protein YbgF
MTRSLGLLSLALVAALAAAAPALAQRQSLGDRVTALEQKAAAQAASASTANVDQLNRINALQQEVTSLRGLVEQLQNEIAQLKQSGRDQYVDLDSRLQRLEGGGARAPATPAAASTPAAPATTTPATAPATAPAAASPAGEAAAYQQAFDALKAGDYVASARGFHDFLTTYPGAALAPNAWYWLGESYYVTQNYPLALESFQTLLSSFPDSGKVPDALLKLGYTQLEMGQEQDGRRTLMQLLGQFPGSDAARLADGRLRSLDLDGR